jgi:hypothetical protein
MSIKAWKVRDDDDDDEKWKLETTSKLQMYVVR